MQHRPLTEEEYAIAGLPLDVCTKCKCRSFQKPYQWCYYRENGSPKILCDACFTRGLDRGGIPGAAFFASAEAAACDQPQRAHEITGLPQIPPDVVTTAFEKFRDLTPEQIRGFKGELPLHPRPGHRVEWFGPVQWWIVLDCLAWLREIDTLAVRYLFGRWEKLESFLATKMPGVDYEPWRQRMAALAQSEILFRYSGLLSDAVSKAHSQAASKKTADKKRKVFADIKAAMFERVPPASLPGAAQELERFIDYMNAQIADSSAMDE